MPSYLAYKKQLTVLDGGDDIERWITVNGNHIPIYEGMSAHLAIQNWIEKKQGNIEGKGYAESVKHYNSKQHGLAAKEYESLAKSSYKKYQKSNYEDEPEWENTKVITVDMNFTKNRKSKLVLKSCKRKPIMQIILCQNYHQMMLKRYTNPILQKVA